MVVFKTQETIIHGKLAVWLSSMYYVSHDLSKEKVVDIWVWNEIRWMNMQTDASIGLREMIAPSHQI